MSQQQYGAPSRSGGGGGSVRRARERMEAGLPPEMPQQTPQQRAPQQKPYEQPRLAPGPPSQIPRLKPQMPAGLAQTRNGQGPIGVAISRPTQVPQWPLAGTIETVQESKNNGYQPPAGRGNAPQRPPRPSHVPSMLDASRLQEHTPTFQYRPQQDQYQGRGQSKYQEEFDDDNITSPITQSSRPSTVSSVGTIPDFPIPMPPPPAAARRSANLGPPPSSRRGASSYYSQASYVSPIPEESPRSQPSHGSYASSAAIPSSWGEESPTYEYDEKYDEKDRGYTHDIIEEGRESRESNDNDDTGLIRSASLGKRAKPTIVTTQSSEKFDPQQQQQQKSKLERMGVLEGAAAGAATWAAMNVAAQQLNHQNEDGQRGKVWPIVGKTNSPLAGGTGLIDKSTSSSETSLPVATAVTTDRRLPADAINNGRSDAQTKEMLGAYNAASSLQPGGVTPTRTPSPGFSRLSAIRRPPRLDIDAVRDAEKRGSLTSLPDLIRRATRLAAMMDRGKRPASRLALDDFPSDSELGKDKEMGISPDEKRQSGLSGMLAAFPPPGLATPREGRTPQPADTWPSPSPGWERDPSSAGLQDEKLKKKGRRCCGLPCWGFLLVLLILLIIIAAAVVVPLELLVLNKPKAAPAAATLTPLQQCQSDPVTSCQNGGSTFLNNGNCACICINGFTGSTCAVASATGCITTTLSSDYPNVTLGDSIPRLIQSAQSNFSIPLFSTVILARFNAANLSCLSENALVTFDGLSRRIGAANAVVVPSATFDTSLAQPTPAKVRVRQKPKREDTTSAPAVSGTATSVPNGIIADTRSAPFITPLPSSARATQTPGTESSPTSILSGVPSASPSSSQFIITEQTLDFARVAVLFVLQQQTLDSAVVAQTSFQRFFSLEDVQVAQARNISLGGGNSADLIGFAVDLGQGMVGGYNSSLVERALVGGGKRGVRVWR